MKIPLFCLFFAALIVKYSISTITKNDKKENNDGTTDAPRQQETGAEDGTGWMSTLGKTIGHTATVALALQSFVAPTFGSRMPSSSVVDAPQQYQEFVPKKSENMRHESFKELHAFPFGQSGKVPKMAEEMENEMAPFAHLSDERKLSGKLVARKKNDPKQETIDPRIYPQPPRGNTTDNYSGTIVSDPYRAFEKLKSRATKHFVNQLNGISEPYLNASPVRQKLNETLTKLWNFEVTYTPMFYGNFYYYYQNSGLQSQRVLYQTKSLNETGKVFLDPNTLSSEGTVAVTIESFSNNGTVMAYGISDKGSDSFTLKFKNSNGNDLTDQITNLRDSELYWLSDDSGLFYSKYQPADETGELKYHSLYFHKMGTAEAKDILVVERRDLPDVFIYGVGSEDGHFLFVLLSDGGSNKQMFYYDLAAVKNKITGPLKLKPLFDKNDAEYQMIDSDDNSVLVYTNKDAPMYQLVRVSNLNGTTHEQHALIKEDTKRLMRFVYPVDENKLLICYLENVQDALYVHDLATGKMLYQIPLPIGSIVMDGSQSESEDLFAYKSSSKLFFKIESFVSPFTIFYVDFADFRDRSIELKVFRQGKVPGLDSDSFVVKQVFYDSNGTKVPMFITYRNGMALDGTNPVFLTGYGGFDYSILPSFSVAHLMFIQHFGGVVAIPNIRGGGEYGEKWHEAGMLKNKQNTFDDFIAAAEFLIREKYTNSSKLAIYGASNGGLLTAVCSQQRPELFGAVITQLGVLDMLRFNKMPVGAAWVPEFGDPDNAQDFSFIYKYSPLHNLKIKPGQQWPATLLMTADHDDRVDPAHTYKYAAQLYHLLGEKNVWRWQHNPVLTKIQVDQGHLITGTPTAKVINEKVDFYSFIQRVLKLKWID